MRPVDPWGPLREFKGGGIKKKEKGRRFFLYLNTGPRELYRCKIKWDVQLLLLCILTENKFETLWTRGSCFLSDIPPHPKLHELKLARPLHQPHPRLWLWKEQSLIRSVCLPGRQILTLWADPMRSAPLRSTTQIDNLQYMDRCGQMDLLITLLLTFYVNCL